nr:unnamed protein product [Digitaria exilis]
MAGGGKAPWHAVVGTGDPAAAAAGAGFGGGRGCRAWSGGASAEAGDLAGEGSCMRKECAGDGWCWLRSRLADGTPRSGGFMSAAWWKGMVVAGGG